MSDEEQPRKVWPVTKEIKVLIKGIEYDAILVPTQDMFEVDYTEFPEDDPLRRQKNIQTLIGVELSSEHVVSTTGPKFRLTEAGARRLLDSL